VIDLPVGLSLVAIGLLCFAVLVRSLITGRIAVFFTKLADIERANEPLRFWTQFGGITFFGAVALFIGALLLS